MLSFCIVKNMISCSSWAAVVGWAVQILQLRTGSSHRERGWEPQRPRPHTDMMTTGPSQCINVLSKCCYLFLLTVKEHSLTPHKGRSSLKQAPNLLQRCWRRLFSLFPLSTSSHGLNSCQSLPLLFLNLFLTVFPFHLGWCSSLLRSLPLVFLYCNWYFTPTSVSIFFL